MPARIVVALYLACAVSRDRVIDKQRMKITKHDLFYADVELKSM